MRTTYALGGLMAAIGFASASHGAIVSLNFENWGSIPNSPTDTAGVVDAPHWNDTWLDNGKVSPMSGLRDDSGAATTVEVSWAAGGEWGLNLWNGDASNSDSDGTASTHNVRLMKGWIDSGDHLSLDVSTVTLTGIPYAVYDVYVYFMSDGQDRPGTVTVGATSYHFLADPGSVTFVDNDPPDGTPDGAGTVTYKLATATTAETAVAANYAVFSGLSGTSQTVTTDVPLGGGIAGIQIVQVPEPSALGLIGLGLGTLTLRRRCRK